MPDRKPFPAKVEDWSAPWEVDADGNVLPAEDQNLDPARLKNYLHGLLSDKIRLQGTIDTSAARVEELERSIAEAPDAAALTAVQTELAQARAAAEAAKNNPNNALALKYEIALEKGLTKSQARRLVGDTREEIEADAAELVKDLGGQQQREQTEETEEPAGRVTPRGTFTNPADPKPGAGADKAPTPDEVFKAYMATR